MKLKPDERYEPVIGLPASGPRSEDLAGWLDYARQNTDDLPRLGAARDELLAAADRAWESGDLDTAYGFWDALDNWLTVNADWAAYQRLCDRAIECARRLGRPREGALALAARSSFRELRAETESARADAIEAVQLARESGDQPALAKALTQLGVVVSDGPTSKEAEAYLAEAWEIAKQLGDWPEAAYVAYHRALSFRSEDSSETQRLLEQSLSIAQTRKPSTVDARRTRSFVLTALGSLMSGRAEYIRANQYFERGLTLKRDIGERYAIANSFSAIAWCEARQGHLASAAALFTEARGLFLAVGSPEGLRHATRDAARVYEQQKAYPEALATYREALGLVDSTREPQFYGVILHDIADVRLAQGELGDAIDLYRQAAEHKAKGDNATDLARTNDALGRALAQKGLGEDALKAYRDALAQASGDVDPHLVGVILHDMADVYREQGDLDQAIDHYRRAVEHKAKGRASSRARTDLALGRALFEKKAYQEALASYRNAQALVDRSIDPELHSAILRSVADVERASVASDTKQRRSPNKSKSRPS